MIGFLLKALGLVLLFVVGFAAGAYCMNEVIDDNLYMKTGKTYKELTGGLK